MKQGFKILYPLLLAIAIVVGIYIGVKYSNSPISVIPNFGQSKINGLMYLISNEYVDSVNIDSLTEKVIPKIIGELDPHSSYIPAEDLEMVNNDLDGSFSGIGIQFSILNDTIMVVDVISGGPSEKAGVLAGDRIVSVNDSSITGSSITNEKVMHRLRGAKNSNVKLSILRPSSKDIIDIDITRGDIPVNSVDVAFKPNDEIGYIKVSKFGKHTYSEFLTSLAKLAVEGTSKFIIDLRGNSGGYMESAINMVNEFLPAGYMIVYTKGNASPLNEVFSNGMGSFQDNQIVVLVDEWSASASEIFAGAIQDNDRGLIIGRRSFGKGLVQQQIPFNDGSAIRLTIARYYTPSGRSIQKEYKMGDSENYEMDLLNRFEHGEFDSQDSIHMNDSIKYKTIYGRTVYGGGGIMPDIFVPRDTSFYSPYLTQVVNNGIIYQFAFKYSDENREKLSKFKSAKSLLVYLKGEDILSQFVAFAASKDIKARPVYINISRKEILNNLYANIARNILGDEAFYPIVLMNDETFRKAVDILNEDKGFPIREEEIYE
ncbi:MAG: PDZ domain-containing protein [Bacteroidales bacterium]|nr:PDZ domain-containing protein [Bacteroidales bacterium]MBR3608546.1 PDZ domain-containing protein [Bacteroidales bacterium]